MLNWSGRGVAEAGVAERAEAGGSGEGQGEADGVAG